MSATISKREHQSNPNSYERLFQLGLTHVQNLSGKIWTDYNLHDPGITILEQVSFALTDVIYRCDFEVADYLTNSQGQIDFFQQGLMTSETILNPPPQQPEDYERWLTESVAGLEQVWVRMSDSSPDIGIYQIYGLPHAYRQRKELVDENDLPRKEPDQRKDIIGSISRSYHATRGLGEDLAEIKLVDGTRVTLVTTITVDDSIYDINNLAATIYKHTHFWILRSSRGNRIESLRESLLSISGIHEIHTLYFEPEDSSNSDNHVLERLPEHTRLIIPDTQDEVRLRLLQNNHEAMLDVGDISFQIDVDRHDKLQESHTIPLDLPTGQWIDYSAYDSIQTLFPRNYHLSAGTPAQYYPQQQAERHQLRSYLLLFDQLMANFCQDLNGIRELFSTSLSTPHSYQIQALNHLQFHEIDQHYPANAEQKLQLLQAQFEHYPERKGRLFDYLIALYGEQFPDQIHRQINPYFSPDDLDWQLLRYKQRFIRNIVPLTNERGLGDDLYSPRHVGGYVHRIALLLGFNQQHPETNTYGGEITQYQLNVTANQDYEQSRNGQRFIFQFQQSIQSKLMPLPGRPDGKIKVTQQQNHQIRSIVIAFSEKTLPEALLQYGVDNDRYRILNQTHKREYQLFFHLESDQWLYISRCRKKEKLIRFCHLFQHWLIQMNRNSEGLYVVEHLLLRPALEEHPLTDYANKVSIVLPAFTARCHNSQFRHLAEKIIRNNTPAHLLVHIYWLDFYPFCEFESHYRAWREKKAQALVMLNREDQQTCDELAARLHLFLQDLDTANAEQYV